ncbi:MAG: AEC family transporter [Boseongicola sp. SB0664_bin_43]|uniref:AEC family transporter n=1 Tax=Boseongicola sp. SB0664_bin_43 TaxID=2604844 RepID=A0A6B0Y0P7_9RHOB|nr:AEC family transporter [Boseongicola sp. SB0664_bin_43]MYK32849.1 AEC family transporter [Boseongicola sp. SB0670_bin_30]
MQSEILNIIAPVFVVAGIGFFLEFRGIGFQSETLTRLATLIGTPSLVFSSLTSTALPSDSLGHIVAISSTAVIVAGALALAALLVLRLHWRTFLSSLSLPNAGNAGLPIVFFAFAEPGLAIGAAFYFVVTLVQYTVVPAVVSGDPGLRKLLRLPLVWSVMAVLLFRITDLPIPTVVADVTALLGGIMIPVMLILLGGALARLKVDDVGTSALLAGARLAIGVATGLTLITVFNLEGVEAGAIFLLSAMPSALITYVIAERYGRSPERVAGLVVSSTVLNFACLPLLITAAIRLAGT